MEDFRFIYVCYIIFIILQNISEVFPELNYTKYLMYAIWYYFSSRIGGVANDSQIWNHVLYTILYSPWTDNQHFPMDMLLILCIIFYNIPLAGFSVISHYTNKTLLNILLCTNFTLFLSYLFYFNYSSFSLMIRS